MKIKSRKLLVPVVGVVLLALAVAWMNESEAPKTPKRQSSTVLNGSPSELAAMLTDSSTGSDSSTDSVQTSAAVEGIEIDNRPPKKPSAPIDSVAALERLLDLAAKRFGEEGLTAAESIDLLEELRNAIFSSDPEIALQGILQFLQSGVDADTLLGFQVGPGGALLEAPTLRVALLDWLGQISIPAAEAVARQFIDQPRNSGEWAIHMRNDAWADPNQTRVQQRVDRLTRSIGHTDWPQTTPPGYLEVFDLLPHTQDTELFVNIARLADDPNAGPLPWAVFLAMDRAILAAPGAFLAEIAASPDLLHANPEIRASLMARADVRAAGQREALERYLRRTDLSAEEAGVFSSIYPNYNLLVGYRLFTPVGSDGASLNEYAERDRAALALLSAWERDASLSPAFRATLPQLRTRIAAHVESARRAAASGELLPGQ